MGSLIADISKLTYNTEVHNHKEMNMATARKTNQTSPNTQFAETESLAAHVAICTVRYDNLEKRIEAVEAKVDEVIEEISNYKDSLVKVIITSTATIVMSLIGLTITIALKLG